jgi:hypothetical protein
VEMWTVLTRMTADLNGAFQHSLSVASASVTL